MLQSSNVFFSSLPTQQTSLQNVYCELCTLDKRELDNCTESTGNVNEGLQRYSRSLFSNTGSTLTTLSGCLFVAEFSSIGAGVTFSGGGVDVPVNANEIYSHPNIIQILLEKL